VFAAVFSGDDSRPSGLLAFVAVVTGLSAGFGLTTDLSGVLTVLFFNAAPSPTSVAPAEKEAMPTRQANQRAPQVRQNIWLYFPKFISS